MKIDIYMKFDKFLNFLVWLRAIATIFDMRINFYRLISVKQISKRQKIKTELNTRSILFFNERERKVRRANYPNTGGDTGIRGSIRQRTFF